MPGKHGRTALDSSYLIALLCDWHVHHVPSRRSFERLSSHGAHFILPAHVVLECYSVLTRIPPPHRLPPDVARQILVLNFAATATIAAVDPVLVWKAIDSLAGRGLGGGRVYDAVIAYCASAAGATVLLTWNAKHFAPVAPPDLEIREP